MTLDAPRTPARTRLRWAVPAVAAAVVTGGVLVGTTAASAAPSLPSRTPAQLLAALAQATPQPFSGTVVETANLGIPALPTGGSGSASTSLASLLSGSHTVRVWYASPTQVKAAMVTDLAESDVVRNGADVWTWDSRRHTATHRTLTGKAATAPGLQSTAPAGAVDPAQMASRVLSAIGPTTVVRVDGTATVAGRSAYELVVSPKQAGSLVASVRLAVDAATSMPLRVRVYAVGQKAPAIQVGFSSFHLGRPRASVFHFTPPAGATVNAAPGGATPAPRSGGTGTTLRPSAPMAQPMVVGTGWTSVAVLRGVDIGQLAGADPTAGRLLSATTRVSGTFGNGSLLRTALITVLQLSDGRVLVGAVTPQVIEAAATAPAHSLG